MSVNNSQLSKWVQSVLMAKRNEPTPSFARTNFPRMSVFSNKVKQIVEGSAFCSARFFVLVYSNIIIKITGEREKFNGTFYPYRTLQIVFSCRVSCTDIPPVCPDFFPSFFSPFISVDAQNVVVITNSSNYSSYQTDSFSEKCEKKYRLEK